MQQLVDLSLLDNRICTDSDTGVHEEFANILQPAGLVVDDVFTLPAAIQPPCDLQCVLLDAHTGDFVKYKADLGHSAGFSAGRTAEYHVGHLAASKALGTLISQHPFYRIDNITLAAAVWPDNRGYLAVDIELRLVREALKAVKHNLIKSHHPTSMLKRCPSL